MDIWQILNWTMSFIALTGTILNAEKSRIGFWFWLISNMYMTIRFFIIGEYAQMTLFFVYTILAIRGLFAWKKKEEKNIEKSEEKIEA